MNYLKKKYLYNFLVNQGFNDTLKLKDFEYQYYRGDEWLKSDDIDLYCVRQKEIYVSIYLYDEELDKRIETNRYAFHKQNNTWLKTYERKRKVI